ncbi:hypothetical protein OsJ_17973 [Oryza sativa Japonica Group]|uniref:GH10 domain-containing protein n=1 Tax=Oryza sativa subsp. japonica TaxID=39947 RepID=B9FNR6_ORYSJ|nr:hypothetical protein OsJ_17973 [Oryza sativa Japonica Group]
MLSEHVVEQDVAMLPAAVDGEREDRPSDRYVVAARRDGEEDGLRLAVPAGALVPRVTYRVSGWVAVQVQGGGDCDGDGERSHVVRVSLCLDDCGVEGECRRIDCGAVRKRDVVLKFGVGAGVAASIVAGAAVRVVQMDNVFPLGTCINGSVRKRDVVLKFGVGAGVAASIVAGAAVRVVQMDNVFPLGTCINGSDPNFVDFFTNNFDWAVFENELKWYWTEAQRGQLNYRDADALLDFCDRHGKQARGHCIFWAIDGDVQQWIKDLGRDDLAAAVQGRLNGLLSRYAGRFPHYDVNNEMLHGRFYRDRLGDDAAALMFREAARLDPGAQLFVNDYNIECANDPNATPEKYVELVDALRRGGAAVGGIGIQGHVSNPSGEVICDALDKLATTGLPGRMWRQDASLVDADGTINEAGQRLVDLRREWMSDARGTVDGDGNFRFRGYHGTYVVQVTTAAGKTLKTFTVDKGDTSLVLATTGLPVWITELDVGEPDVSLRADDLEVVLREAYAHPAVAGVVLWGFMQGRMWRQDASLVDADGTINEAGQRLVDLRRDWMSDARGTVDGDGNFRFRGYHGHVRRPGDDGAGEDSQDVHRGQRRHIPRCSIWQINSSDQRA